MTTTIRQIYRELTKTEKSLIDKSFYFILDCPLKQRFQRITVVQNSLPKIAKKYNHKHWDFLYNFVNLCVVNTDDLGEYHNKKLFSYCLDELLYRPKSGNFPGGQRWLEYVYCFDELLHKPKSENFPGGQQWLKIMDSCPTKN